MRILITIVLLTLLSCKSGLTESEEKTINLSLTLHNQNARLKFALDSIEEVTKYRIEHIATKNHPDFDKWLQSHMDVFENEWNSPYDIKKDRNLTMDKYLDYCKAYNHDPKAFYKFMD